MIDYIVKYRLICFYYQMKIINRNKMQEQCRFTADETDCQ
jgi:hypothetical protein